MKINLNDFGANVNRRSAIITAAAFLLFVRPAKSAEKSVEVLNQGPRRAKLQIACEDGASRFRLFGHHHKLLVDATIA
jgi:hypothetical protein